MWMYRVDGIDLMQSGLAGEGLIDLGEEGRMVLNLFCLFFDGD